MVPIAGVVVAATTLGTLLMVSGPSGATESQDPSADLPDASEVEIGEAVVQERLPDGTPGPVVPRT